MKTLALFLFVLVVACCLSPPAAIAQPGAGLDYELACPAGSSPLSSLGKTFNALTGRWRANWCIATDGSGVMIGNGVVLPTYTATTMPSNEPTNGAVIVRDTKSCTSSDSAGNFTWCVWNGLSWIPFLSNTFDPIRLTNGSVGAPAYAFNATNYGMWRDTVTSGVAFSVNGSNALELFRGGVGGPVKILQLPDDLGGICMGATPGTLDACIWRLGGAQWAFGNGTVSDWSGTIRVGAISGGNTGDLSGFNSFFANTLVNGPKYQTATNCSSAAAPAVCGSAAAGRVVIAAAATTVVVNTTAVTASSNIRVQFDESITGLGTCNTAAGSEAATYFVSAKSAGTSFTIKTSAAPVTNPACLNYFMVN